MPILSAIWDRITREPVLVTTFVGAVLACLVAFGLHLTEEQTTAIIGVIAAVMAVFAREQVTPTKAPVLDKGTAVTIVTPAGTPNTATIL